MPEIDKSLPILLGKYFTLQLRTLNDFYEKRPTSHPDIVSSKYRSDKTSIDS